MTIEEKTKLFKRLLKELGIYTIYIQDKKKYSKEILKDAIEYLNNNYEENDYDTPSEVINQSLCWACTDHQDIWSSLYDYLILEANTWEILSKNLEIVVGNIKKYAMWW